LHKAIDKTKNGSACASNLDEEEELLNKSKSLLHSLDASANKINTQEVNLLERYNSRGTMG
jgi:hypothetical protein